MKRIVRFLPACVLSAAFLAACGTTPTASTPTQPAAATAAPTTATAAEPTSAATSAPAEATTAATSMPAEATVGATSEAATPQGPLPTPTFAPPTADYQAITSAILTPIKESYPDTPVVVGVTGIEGDYASALASPFGQRPQFAWLKREGSDWTVVFLSSMPSSSALAELDVPQSLMSSSDTTTVLDAVMAQLQNPQGQGVDGVVTVEGVSGDYARISFTPSDINMVESYTAFWKRENDMWKQLTAGSAFGPDTLKELGIPEELWSAPQL